MANTSYKIIDNLSPLSSLSSLSHFRSLHNRTHHHPSTSSSPPTSSAIQSFKVDPWRLQVEGLSKELLSLAFHHHLLHLLH
ncbi:hypothetical protein Hanom_Chr02g00137011 [Helianthus anomalus]